MRGERRRRQRRGEARRHRHRAVITMMANLGTVLEVVTATDPGMVRSHNEDSIGTDAEIGLAVLADGMGGYNAGEVASGIAVELILTEMKKALAGKAPDELNGKE